MRSRVLFCMRTFGREQGLRLIGRREFLGEAHRLSVTVGLDHWDVDALLSGRLLRDPHDASLSLQRLTMDSYVRLD